jgi:hypothetical protein
MFLGQYPKGLREVYVDRMRTTLINILIQIPLNWHWITVQFINHHLLIIFYSTLSLPKCYDNFIKFYAQETKECHSDQ